jgi:putative transposase
MPNHIHVIWRTNGKNGRETVQGSFLKFTAHTFQQKLVKESPSKLEPFRVAASNKSHEFWQRDSLAIHLYSPEIAYQKLDYIHNNPLAKHWNLAFAIEEYRWSSASYYLKNKSEFPFLKDLRVALHGE